MIWSSFIIYAEIKDYVLSGRCIFSDKYGNLDDETPFIKKFIELLPSLENIDDGYKQIGKVNFIYYTYNDLVFVCCASTDDDVLKLKQKITRLLREFFDKYKKYLENFPTNLSVFNPFKEIIKKEYEKVEEQAEKIEQVKDEDLIKIKIGIVGFENVGKRSLTSLIFGYKPDPEKLKNEPQVFMKRGQITQEYKALIITLPLDKFEDQKMLLKNSDIIFIVVNSEFQNVINTQNYLDSIQELVDPSKTYVIANKQDLDNALKTDVIAKMTGIQTLGMSAINIKYYSKIIETIEELL
ncbi:MAG: hypothetical protein GF329_14300 [Candidatus Lokiarchaeota archaeon]|nr:hypothetical protein [Candidatus Lokiarchaeota archaeon]